MKKQCIETRPEPHKNHNQSACPFNAAFNMEIKLESVLSKILARAPN